MLLASVEQDDGVDKASFSSSFFSHELIFSGINISRHLLLEFQQKLFNEIFQQISELIENMQRKDLDIQWNEDQNVGSPFFLLTRISVKIPSQTYVNQQKLRSIVSNAYHKYRVEIRQKENEPVQRNANSIQ